MTPTKTPSKAPTKLRPIKDKMLAKTRGEQNTSPKRARKKTVLINPLTEYSKNNTSVLNSSLRSTNANKAEVRKPKIYDKASLKKAASSIYAATLNITNVEKKVEFYEAHKWSPAKIELVKGQQGFRDLSGHFYSFNSYEALKKDLPKTTFSQLGILGVIVGGLPGLVTAGIISFWDNELYGFVSSNENSAKKLIKTRDLGLMTQD
jgi:hypothetical protein